MQTPDPKMIGRHASVHCKPCSNWWCCGNRRFIEGPTWQEVHAALSEAEALLELDWIESTVDGQQPALKPGGHLGWGFDSSTFRCGRSQVVKAAFDCESAIVGSIPTGHPVRPSSLKDRQRFPKAFHAVESCLGYHGQG